MNDSQKVSTGKPKVGGAIFRAPLGTALPKDAKSELNVAFKGLGYISDEGVTNTNSPETNDTKAWGGDIVLSSQTAKKDALNKDYLTWFVGGSSILATLLLGLISAKNIRKSDELIKKSAENTRKGLDNIIKSFNEKEKIIPVKDHDGNILKGIDAYKYVIETMLEKLYAKPEDIEDVVSKMNLSKEEKEIFAKELKKSMNRATEKVNGAIGGSGRNKITYFSHVNDYLSFFYDWLMNPKNPQFKNLFLGIAGISALGYCGKSSVEAIKEVQVKKYNAQTELDLQKRLVATELKNFKAKKESAINPLCEEFQIQLKNGKPVEELKIMADNILFEIKNGPPFVYS